MENSALDRKVDYSNFYDNYHGHLVKDLSTVHEACRTTAGSHFVFLAGDSTLDNKFWFRNRSPACNGYERILSPPFSIQDVCYWLNFLLENNSLGRNFVALNCAVEESTLGARSCARLLPQDKFIRNTVTQNDVLVVSVGGNDVALKPSCCTALNMLSLVCLASTSCIESMSCGSAFPCRDDAWGCSFGCLSSMVAFPPGLGYFIHLFGTQLQDYILNLTALKKPKLILVCMLYYLDEKSTGSWADNTLGILGYNRNPKKLQTVIKRIYELAVKSISIPGTKVVAVPLFSALDGTNTSDYVQRVEPSAAGGRKIAELLIEYIRNNYPGLQSTQQINPLF